MAVKEPPQNVVPPERNAKQSLRMTTPVFLDGASLTIPTLTQLQADGEMVAGAAAAPMSTELAKKSMPIWSTPAFSMSAWSVHSARGG